jgi:phage recombination protein Bet
MENAVARVEKAQPCLSIEIIKKYVCPKATDQEAYMFMQLCNLQGLNPFLREAYLIKYGDEAATIITGKDTFTKRADKLPQYDGFKAGIIVVDNSKQCQYREGSFLAPGETLLGGWAEVFRKDRAHSFRNEVSLEEYARKKKDGSLMSNWKSMPATMIRKVPLVQSLREAFPDEFGGMYSPEEMPIDASTLPIYTEGKAPIITVQDAKEPVKAPQKKAPEESSEVNTITAIVSDVRKTTGVNEKTQKAWTKFIVKCGDVEYSTFSETYAKVAKDAKEAGVEVIINFTTNKFGNEIKAIVANEPGDVA